MRWFLLLGLFSLSGCEMLGLEDGGGGGGGQAARKAKSPGAAGGSVVTRLDRAIAAQEGYVYNPIGKRDPFRSFLAAGERGVEDETPRTPLQRYEIDEYFLK